MVWGPDGGLYVGGVGMNGGWSWKEKQYGLQKLTYNGKTTFEMLAIKATPGGFEITFTEPLKAEITASDLTIQQWRYEATAAYGGPKIDLRNMPIQKITNSEDRAKINIQLSGLKTGHVIYFKLSDQIMSATNQPLWSGEAWYTLNRTVARDYALAYAQSGSPSQR